MAKGAKRAKKRKVGEVRRDAGTEAAQRKRELFGTDGSDAIGRAYRSGLLGEDGQTLLQTARSINRAYWAAYGQYSFTCALGSRTGAANDDDNSLARERWLNATIREIDAMGRAHRKAFDELCLDFHPDHGPDWIDRLIAKEPTQGDWSKLARALEVLAGISG
jgi:hypothetical protein